MPVKKFYPEIMYFQVIDKPKTMEEVSAERDATLWLTILLTILSVGLPLFINLGKALFEVQPIIY